MNSGEVGSQREMMTVTQWNINEAVMGKSGHQRKGSGLLTSS
jgi:hypothetical protein